MYMHTADVMLYVFTEAQCRQQKRPAQVRVSSSVLNITYLWASPVLLNTNQLFPLTAGRGLC